MTQATFWDALTSIRKVLARSVFVAIGKRGNQVPHCCSSGEDKPCRAAFARALFKTGVRVSIADSEFTGLWAKDQYPRRLDAYQARYSKVKAAAEAFMPVQLGTCK